DVQINAIRRELELLVQVGIIKEIEKKHEGIGSKSGETLRKYYAIDPTCPFYSDLMNMFIKDQTVSEQQFLKDVKEKAGEIKLFLLTGRFTNDHDSTSDMLLVGDIKPRVLEKLIEEHEKEYGFEIRYTVMTEKEYRERRYVMDKFLFSMFEGKHVTVVDLLTEEK
ncbi:MAG: hypothetical protein V1848_00785, partial [Candidatus Magasanikbacteria bacterium]